jgi:excinuclease UvrABC nuclease subunit
VLKELEGQMRASADVLDFESAAILRDKIQEISQMQVRMKKNGKDI